MHLMFKCSILSIDGNIPHVQSITLCCQCHHLYNYGNIWKAPELYTKMKTTVSLSCWFPGWFNASLVLECHVTISKSLVYFTLHHCCIMISSMADFGKTKPIWIRLLLPLFRILQFVVMKLNWHVRDYNFLSTPHYNFMSNEQDNMVPSGRW